MLRDRPFSLRLVEEASVASSVSETETVDVVSSCSCCWAFIMVDILVVSVCDFASLRVWKWYFVR